MILVAVFMFSSSVFADSGSLETDKILTETDELKESYELEKFSNSPLKSKLLERSFSTPKASVLSDDENVEENTDPNNALYLAPNTGAKGNIVQDKEIRWYITQLDEKSRYKLFLLLNETQDFDIYLFKFNQDAGKLDFIEAPVLGLGEGENIDKILDKGIYFIGVEAKTDTGEFSLYTFASTFDIANEINDTLETATSIKNEKNLEISGVIDNPTDLDYYKIECDVDEVAKFEVTIPDGEDYNVIHIVGQDKYLVKQAVKFRKGTNYLLVISKGNSYSQTKLYKLKKTFSSIYQKVLMENIKFIMILQEMTIM